MSKNKRLLTTTKISCNILAGLFGLLLVGGKIANENASAINAFLKISTQKSIQIDDGEEQDSEYYTTEYWDIVDLRESATDINQRVVEEGSVLLKNEKNALPLDKGSKVSLFSSSSVNSVITGAGSGGINPSAVELATSLYDGLEEAGLNINKQLWDWYAKNSQYYNDGTYSSRGNGSQTCTFDLKDANWSQIDSSKSQKADAAIFVLARNGGEDADMSTGGSKGDYLALTENEKSVLVGLKALKDQKVVSKIIVLMNSANQVACNFVNDEAYGIDAMLWCGTLGTSGAKAVGNLLTGEANPSGKLSDTFWYNHSENPVYPNFGVNEYNNSNLLPKISTSTKRVGSANGANRNHVVYQESIYNGYRYTETRYEDKVLSTENVGEYNYQQVVSYPFGYGLSYTDFSYSNYNVEKKEENNKTTYVVSVTVKNNGDRAGKEVVQVYLQKPYTAYDMQHTVEKASVELVGFAKTNILQEGESQVVSIEIDEKTFASYDSYFAKTYVVGSENTNDQYYLTVASDSHEAVNNILAKKGKTKADGMTKDGNTNFVYSTYLPFSNTKYATNELIEKENKNFKASYTGEKANYGVDKITNQFNDVDPNLYEENNTIGQVTYTTRSNWSQTTGIAVQLTANDAVLKDMTYTEKPAEDEIEYPTYGEENQLNLIHLRVDEKGNKISYNDPLWEKLLNQLSWDDYMTLLSDGLRCTQALPSIGKPKTYEQNGPVGPVQKYNSNSTGSPFEGYAKLYEDEDMDSYPSIYTCNGIVASTYNVDLIEELGTVQGEECLWAGYSGIYGLGLNIHRGSYNGRAFEYYSEDGFLTGMMAGYESKGMQSKGVYVLTKHAILNEQETCRYNGATWANEQTIREIYLKPFEVSIQEGNTNGVMTGLNRIGSKWTSEQGFCESVLRAEFGLEGIIITDFYSPTFMTLTRSLMGGTNLPDGQINESSKNITLQNLNLYSKENGNYGELAWKMRESAHRILYSVVHSNAMNYITSSTRIITITPLWQTLILSGTIVSGTLLGLNFAGYVTLRVLDKKKAKQKVNKL